MRYRVDDEIFDDIDSVLGYCIEEGYHRDDDYFSEWVDEKYDCIEIGGRTFYAYEIVSEIDSGLLDSLLDDFCENMNDSDWENADYMLRHSNVGDEVDCQNYTIEVIEDEEMESSDTDGDLESVRQFIKDQEILKQQKKEQEKKEEDDLMKLFQTIGG